MLSVFVCLFVSCYGVVAVYPYTFVYVSIYSNSCCSVSLSFYMFDAFLIFFFICKYCVSVHVFILHKLINECSSEIE